MGCSVVCGEVRVADGAAVYRSVFGCAVNKAPEFLYRIRHVVISTLFAK